MTTFDNREKGYENKFAHDQDLRFKAEVRRDRMLGAWAAKLMGLGAAETDAYVKALVKEDMKEPGDADVFAKLRADFDAKGIAQSDQQIRRQMDECFAAAVQEVEASKS